MSEPAEGLKIGGKISNTRAFDGSGFESNSAKIFIFFGGGGGGKYPNLPPSPTGTDGKNWLMKDHHPRISILR